MGRNCPENLDDTVSGRPIKTILCLGGELPLCIKGTLVSLLVAVQLSHLKNTLEKGTMNTRGQASKDCAEQPTFLRNVLQIQHCLDTAGTGSVDAEVVQLIYPFCAARIHWSKKWS